MYSIAVDHIESAGTAIILVAGQYGSKQIVVDEADPIYEGLQNWLSYVYAREV